MTLQTKECHEAGENLLVQEKGSPASAPSCYFLFFFLLPIVIVFIQIKKRKILHGYGRAPVMKTAFP